MPSWLDDVRRIDLAVYGAIAATETPELDSAMRGLSRSADFSRLWLASAGGIALIGGHRGRVAASRGLIAIGVASGFANLIAKPLSRRRRPDRHALAVIGTRHVPMPLSSSFPSGHTASAFAFATGAAHILPSLSAPLRMAATLVGYSRVHTGVHYPGDVAAGAFIGITAAELANLFLDRH